MYAPTMLDYQRQLIIANFDDFSPNAVFPEYCGGQYGSFHDEWGRRVIDFLCVNVQCNFIEPINFSDLLGNRGVDSLRNLLTNESDCSDVGKDVIWNALYFSGTERLAVVMRNFGLNGWDAVKKI